MIFPPLQICAVFQGMIGWFTITAVTWTWHLHWIKVTCRTWWSTSPTIVVVSIVDCDVVPMSVCHLLLGCPWQYEKAVMHDGRTNYYSFKAMTRTSSFAPWRQAKSLQTTPRQSLEHNMRNLQVRRVARERPNLQCVRTKSQIWVTTLWEFLKV